MRVVRLRAAALFCKKFKGTEAVVFLAVESPKTLEISIFCINRTNWLERSFDFNYDIEQKLTKGNTIKIGKIEIDLENFYYFNKYPSVSSSKTYSISEINTLKSDFNKDLKSFFKNVLKAEWHFYHNEVFGDD